MINLEDQIDDLFREARENYPLKTGDGDWDSVLNEMKNTGGGAIAPTQNQDKYRRLFWLLLLLPIGWIINTKFAVNTVPHKSNKIRKEKSIAATNDFFKMNPMKNKIIVPENTTSRLNNLAITNATKPFGNNNSTPANNKVTSSYSNSTALNTELNQSLTLNGIDNRMKIVEPALNSNTGEHPSTVTASLKGNVAQNLLSPTGTINSSPTNEIIKI